MLALSQLSQPSRALCMQAHVSGSTLVVTYINISLFDFFHIPRQLSRLSQYSFAAARGYRETKLLSHSSQNSMRNMASSGFSITPWSTVQLPSLRMILARTVPGFAPLHLFSKENTCSGADSQAAGWVRGMLPKPTARPVSTGQVRRHQKENMAGSVVLVDAARAIAVSTTAMLAWPQAQLISKTLTPQPPQTMRQLANKAAGRGKSTSTFHPAILPSLLWLWCIGRIGRFSVAMPNLNVIPLGH